MTGRARNHQLVVRHWGSVAIIALAGCASAPPPQAELDAAESAIAQARSLRAADFSPIEFAAAEEKRAQARAAFAARKYDDARRLAEQSLVDSELAVAKSQAARIRAEVQKKSAQNERLRADLLGGGGAS